MTREQVNRNHPTREYVVLGSLLSLFDLAQRGIPASTRLVADRLGVPEFLISGAMDHLEERGLVDSERVRLTLRGLTIASALRAARDSAESESTPAAA